MDYQLLMNTIDAQESVLRLDSFSNKEGLKIGLFLVDYAKKNNLTMAIAVRKTNGALVFQHLMDGTNPNNHNWMRRKFNTVCFWEHSSLRAFAHEKTTGETIYTHGFDEKEYIQCGGGFPLLLKSGEFVGVITVSNLPHILDHQFIIDALSEYLKVENVPSVSDFNV